MKKLVLLSVMILPLLLSSQNKWLQSGPMLGYSEMREVAIWVQTTEPARVFAMYWLKDNPDKKYRTNRVKTHKDEAFTALLLADSVEPGNIYDYHVFINNQLVELNYPTYFQTQKLWKWRTDPPAFSFLMGSGAYINETAYDRPGDPYGGDYQIYEHMADRQADFMLWLGDNVYFREADWNSWTGIVGRYTHDRSIPELQRFLSTTHHYAILDDHDFGPNDSDRSFWNKDQTMEAFEMFWANPTYGVGEIYGAITAFQWADADFFLLDNRSFRTPNRRKTGEKTILGEDQLQWLFDNLSSSYAQFKFVVLGGQLLSNSAMYESYANYGFDKERERIIDFIQKEGIQNVVFLTGDVHFSEITVLEKKGKPIIWDITSSPMNSGANDNAINQPNTLRIQESVIMERNFCEIAISGERKNRVLQVNYYDANGELLYTHTIKPEARMKK